MSSNPDLEREEIEQYKPPLRTMTKFTLVVMWILLFIAIWWNQTNVPADPWWVLGMPFCGLITFITLYGPAEVKLASPGGISHLHHDSIKTNKPIKKIPPIPGRPELGIYSLGSVDAPHFGIGTFVGTRELIIVPTKLALEFGLNVAWNAVTEDYTDHTQLPPDVYEALQGLNEYKPDMHIEYGLRPRYWNQLNPKDIADFKDGMRYVIEEQIKMGAPQKLVDEMYLKMHELATTVSPFELDATITNVAESSEIREKKLNHQVIEDTAIIQRWESLYGTLMATVDPRKRPPPPSTIEKLATMGGGNEQDQGGGQSG